MKTFYFSKYVLTALLVLLILCNTGCNSARNSTNVKSTCNTVPPSSSSETSISVTATPIESTNTIPKTTESPSENTEISTTSTSASPQETATETSPSTELDTVYTTEATPASTASFDDSISISTTATEAITETIEVATEVATESTVETTTNSESETEDTSTSEVIDPAAIAAYGCAYAQSLGFTVDPSVSAGYLPGLDYPIASMAEGYNHIAGCVTATRDQLIAANGTIEGCRINCVVEYSRTDEMGDWYIFWCFYG